MAEERLIDADKDKKYRIRKNADGEDELYLVEDDGGEEEVAEINLFEVADVATDDGDAGILTPEQLAERKSLREREENARKSKLQACIAQAESKLAEGDYEGALYCVGTGEEIDEKCGELYCLKLRAVSRELTDFSALEGCAEAAEGVDLYASDQLKSQLFAKTSVLRKLIGEREKEISELSAENEKQKAERREVFRAERDKRVKFFLFAALPFLICIAFTIAFATLIASELKGVYLTLTIVFACCAAITFLLTLFMSRRLWASQRNLRMNESDSSTKAGRELIEKRKLVQQLNRIYIATNANL